MNSTRVPLCPPHTPGNNVWQLHCTVCGIRLLEGGISIEQLVGRVESLVQEPVSATGRIRGTWCELLEEGDGQLWAYWARPARNFAGYEAVDTTDPEPSGEQLSALLLAELAGLPPASPEPEIGTAWSRPKPRKASRWARLVRRCRMSEEKRRFTLSAAFLAALQGLVLLVVLGPDGFRQMVATVVNALF